MKRSQYLTGEVAEFRDWLAQRLCGAPIGFAVRHARVYGDLHSALAAYRWPLRAKNALPNPDGRLTHVHPAVPRLSAHSDLAANTHVLTIIQKALHGAYNAGPRRRPELAGAVAAVFHWGGVYTARGNKGWLAGTHGTLFETLREVVRDHAGGDDVSAVADLRFNSGMTKVYSLLIDGFIIYDSRVAAALTWLILQWWIAHRGAPASTLPELLRFGCLGANGAMAAHRNPDARVFRTLSSRPALHYTWNIRANWLLSSALHAAGSSSRFRSLREVEAALFQMGDRVI